MPVIRQLPVGYADVGVILSLANDPEPMVVTMGANPATQPTVADANAIKLAFATRFTARICSVYTLESVHILYQLDAVLQVTVDSNTIANGMTNGGSPCPQNTAVLIRKNTGFAGRAYRGRNFVPGINETAVGPTGEITTAELTAWQTAADGFLADFNAVFPAVLIHSCEHLVTEPPCVPPLPTDITNLQVDDLVATQRRRLRR